MSDDSYENGHADVNNLSTASVREPQVGNANPETKRIAIWMAAKVTERPAITQAELINLARKEFNIKGLRALQYALWCGFFERHHFYGRMRLYPVDVAPHRVIPADLPPSVTTKQLILDYITAHPGCTRVELCSAICGASTRRLGTVLGHLQRMADGGEIRATYAGEHLTYTTVTNGKPTT